MGMVVRTNNMAINANNALTKNNSTVAKNLEKLSTGMRINRAADDASGLAISEKMKAQIKALDTASTNAQDGISLIQTAEGYLGEVHDMLNRMVELAEKSANGTYETVDGGATAENYANVATDRKALQNEMDQLSAEIDRIADTANFNNIKIMNGELKSEITEADFTKATTINPGLVTLKSSAQGKKDTDNLTADTEYFTADGKKFVAQTGQKAIDITGDATTKLYELGDFDTPTYDKDTINSSETVFFTKDGTEKTLTKTSVEGTAGGLKLQIGETSKASDKLTVSVNSFYTKDLFAAMADGNTEAAKSATLVNVKSAMADGLTINISNQDLASKAAESIRTVINDVSAQRASLGAMQNRLEYTINNLNTASENITSANSRIRDTDMAKTMMQYTQGNVLTQAAQAMLAQANQAPQGVLQLLQ